MAGNRMWKQSHTNTTYYFVSEEMEHNKMWKTSQTYMHTIYTILCTCMKKWNTIKSGQEITHTLCTEDCVNVQLFFQEALNGTQQNLK